MTIKHLDIILMILVLILVIFKMAHGKDRCQEYIPDIRAYGIQYNGLDFPWWYNVGCAITETSCRGNLTSFDGGIGLFQFTPSTGVTATLSKYITIDPYNTKSSIRGQAYYIMHIRSRIFKK